MDSADPGLFNEQGVLYYELKRYEQAENAFVSVLRAIDSFPPVVVDCLVDCRLRNRSGSRCTIIYPMSIESRESCHKQSVFLIKSS